MKTENRHQDDFPTEPFGRREFCIHVPSEKKQSAHRGDVADSTATRVCVFLRQNIAMSNVYLTDFLPSTCCVCSESC